MTNFAVTRYARLTLLSLTACAVVGCGSNNEEFLQIRHSFVPLGQQDNLDRFEFNLTWFVPPSVLFGSEKQSLLANMGLRSTSSARPSLDIDNETRLRLEEIAIKRLENELIDNQMCLQGYEITQTKWLDRSIEFSGRCG